MKNQLNLITNSLIDSLLNNNQEFANIVYNEQSSAIFSLLKSTECSEKQIRLDPSTSIISFPNKSDVVKFNYERYKYQGVPEDEFYGAGLQYVKKLNLLVMGNDASHRLAGLNLYLRDGHFIDLNSHYFNCVTIDLNILRKYDLVHRTKELYYQNGDFQKKYKLSHEMYDLIVNLQKSLLGQKNQLGFISAFIKKYKYKNRVLSPIEKARQILQNY